MSNMMNVRVPSQHKDAMDEQAAKLGLTSGDIVRIVAAMTFKNGALPIDVVAVMSK